MILCGYIVNGGLKGYVGQGAWIVLGVGYLGIQSIPSNRPQLHHSKKGDPES